MIIEKQRLDGGITLFEVEGIIKLGESAEFLCQSLGRALTEDSGAVWVDLSRVNSIDSTGLGELVSYLERFRSADRSLELVGPSERVSRLLEVSGLDDLFPVHDSLDAALAAERSEG